MFNEKEFITWLQADTSKPFLIEENKRHYSSGKHLVKVQANDEYFILMNYREKDYNNLTNFYYSRNSFGDFEYEGIYFPKLNTIVFESSYNIDLIKKNCKEIKIEFFGDIEKILFEQINIELNTREEYLKEAFKSEFEEIEEIKNERKDTFFKEYVGYREEDKKYLYDHSWKKIYNRQMVYDYLLDYSYYVKNFVNDYLKNKDSQKTIKLLICKELAKIEYINEIKDNSYTKKTKFIQDLLKNELISAKKIWVITKFEEKQVENKLYDVDSKLGYIGEYSEKINIMDITMIKFSRKEYLIPNFN